MSDAVINISDDNFEAETNAGMVLVDFWAPWCGPCKQLAPIFESIAEEGNYPIKFAKMNVDDNTDVPAKHGVRGIPTLILFKDGKPEATKVGSLTQSELKAFLDQHVDDAVET